MKLKDCPLCGRRFSHRFGGQWRCPACTARWRAQKIQEREQQALAKLRRQVHAPGAPAPLASSPADVSVQEDVSHE